MILDPFRPADVQSALPLDQILRREEPGEDAVALDVLFVGAGPAGLSGAIALAQLCRADPALRELEIGVLEKAEELGQHCLSGAVVNPSAFRLLFPDSSDAEFPFRRAVAAERVYWLSQERAHRIPIPPPMRNHGNYVASICEIVRWLGAKAEALGVHVFTSTPAAALLVRGEAVVGVRTTAAGLGADGRPGPQYRPPGDLSARVVVLAEGTRGLLAQGWLAWQKVSAPNPQIFALGVKELWETKSPLDAVVHTVGWPLARETFGGSFVYPLEDRLVALGLVVGLDSPDGLLDVHGLVQRFKTHPLLRDLLGGGELVEWGAKTIPEGGYYSLPERLSGDGCLLLGDAAGFVDVASLKGIHYAMESGILAARAIRAALAAEDVGGRALSRYDDLVLRSRIHRDLKRRRAIRLGYRDGFLRGSLRAAASVATRGLLPFRQPRIGSDAEVVRRLRPTPAVAADGRRTFRKVDAVYRSGNHTRDDIPPHLQAPEDLSPAMAAFLEALCPAGVYEAAAEGLRINAPNCVDCKATDVLGPRWAPREGGSGPRYRRM